MSDEKPDGAAGPELDEELDLLQERVPGSVSKLMMRVRAPSAKPYRIPIGIALTVGGVFGFLPLVGFWMVPLGLAVLAQDVPVIRPPLARAVAWVNKKSKKKSSS
jgi:hypothetical protein